MKRVLLKDSQALGISLVVVAAVVKVGISIYNFKFIKDELQKSDKNISRQWNGIQCIWYKDMDQENYLV